MKFYLQYDVSDVEGAEGKVREYYEVLVPHRSIVRGHADATVTSKDPEIYAAFKAAYLADKEGHDAQARKTPNQPYYLPEEEVPVGQVVVKAKKTKAKK